MVFKYWPPTITIAKQQPRHFIKINLLGFHLLPLIDHSNAIEFLEWCIQITQEDLAHVIILTKSDVLLNNFISREYQLIGHALLGVSVGYTNLTMSKNYLKYKIAGIDVAQKDQEEILRVTGKLQNNKGK